MSGVVDLSEQFRVLPKDKKPGCMCTQIFVVEHTRMLECQKCGRVIDPFDFMMKEARKQKTLYWDTTQSKQKIKRLHEEIDDLKRQRANLKAQIRRAEKRKAKQ